MLAHGNIKAAAAGKDARLIGDRLPAAVHALLRNVNAGRAAACPRTATRAGALLLRVIVVFVLLAGQRQVTTDLQRHRFPRHLRAGQRRIPPADKGHLITRVNLAFGMAQSIGVFMALRAVNAPRDAEARSSGPHTEADANRPTFAAVFTARAFLLCGRQQVDIAVRRQQQIMPHLKLAALHPDIPVSAGHAAAAGGDAQVVTRRQAAATLGGLLKATLRGR